MQATWFRVFSLHKARNERSSTPGWLGKTEMPQFFETEDSIDESVEKVVDATWDQVSEGRPRLRKVALIEALKYWTMMGYVVIPDDYMRSRT